MELGTLLAELVNSSAFKFFQVILYDVVLSADNALVIGMAAAVLAPHLRKRAIIFGLVVATVFRIAFALIATQLLGIPGLLFLGGLLLFWVSWRLYQDIKGGIDLHSHDDAGPNTGTEDRGAIVKALLTITIADISMSIDNVLAVAATARGDVFVLVFGLILAIMIMALFSGVVVKLLTRFPWIAWLGLILLLLLGCQMIWEGSHDFPKIWALITGGEMPVGGADHG